MKAKSFFKILPGFCLLFLLLTSNVSAQGSFEFGFHYGSWSIDILRGIIEEGLSDGMESTFRGDFLADIQQDHPLLTDVGYTQDVSFDSSGHNLGFEVRWYPGGRYSSFSFGLSVEKTTMEVSIPTVAAEMELSDGSSFEADGRASFIMKPLSFHLSFRWDIVASSPFHPYITFGFGAATGAALENGEFSYSYSGNLNIEGETESYSGDDTETLNEFIEELEEEEEEFFLPSFIPFIQLNLGLKGEVTENIHLLVDAGIFNGFMLRGGLAFRF